MRISGGHDQGYICMYMYICICIYTYIHTYICTYVYISICIYIYIYVCPLSTYVPPFLLLLIMLLLLPLLLFFRFLEPTYVSCVWVAPVISPLCGSPPVWVAPAPSWPVFQPLEGFAEYVRTAPDTVSCRTSECDCVPLDCISHPPPSNLPKGFQRFGFENHFGAGVSSDLGLGLGLLRVQSLPRVHPNPFVGPILDSTSPVPTQASAQQRRESFLRGEPTTPRLELTR